MSGSIYVTTGAGTAREVYHTREDCRNLELAANYREVAPDVAPTICAERRGCDVCQDGMQTVVNRELSTCRSCGSTLREDGSCPFCEACSDAGIHNGRHKHHRRQRREAGDD